MEARTDDFIREVNDITPAVLLTWGVVAIKQWMKDWGIYIKSGGIRPGRPH